MPIQYRCPMCRQYLSIATRMAGQNINCPSCGADHTVPAAESAAAPSEPNRSVGGVPESVYPHQSFLVGVESLAQPIGPRPGEVQGVLSSVSGSGGGVISSPGEEGDDEEDLIRSFDRESDEMDLTPMVDCVFLLLIFFMITASFSVQKTIQVPPPDPDKQGAAVSVQTVDDLEQTSVIVRIDERNTIYIDDEPLSDPEELVNALRDKMSAEQKNELVLEAHARAFHETVIAVVDAANEVQFQKVRLATTPGSDTD